MNSYLNIEKRFSELGPYNGYIGYGGNKVWRIHGNAKSGFVAITTQGDGGYHYSKTLYEMSKFLENVI